MISPGDVVLAGVSGGPDSVALLHLLQRLKEELGFELYASHLNHMFRGEEAVADARLVEGLTGEWGIPLISEKINVPEYLKNSKLSPQIGAREIRYRFFKDSASKMGANRIALGHHADDQAETVLINLIRGSGITGLKGIPPVREGLYIRPLMGIRRIQIEEYCRSFGIPYRMDSSNLKTIYFRNRIRLELIPLLEEKYNPAVVESLNRLADLAREEDMLLDSISRAAYEDSVDHSAEDRIVFSLDKIKCYPTAVRRRVVRIAVRRLAGYDVIPGYGHTDRVEDIINSGINRGRVDLPGGISTVIRYRLLEIIKNKNENEVPFYEYMLEIPGITCIQEIGRIIIADIVNASAVDEPRRFNGNEALLDLDRINGALFVRRRKEGDIFSPLGTEGRVKLKKFLIDQKVPREKRDSIPIVTCGNDIVWVGGLRPGHNYRVTEKTQNCLLLKMGDEKERE